MIPSTLSASTSSLNFHPKRRRIIPQGCIPFTIRITAVHPIYKRLHIIHCCSGASKSWLPSFLPARVVVYETPDDITAIEVMRCASADGFLSRWSFLIRDIWCTDQHRIDGYKYASISFEMCVPNWSQSKVLDGLACQHVKLINFLQFALCIL